MATSGEPKNLKIVGFIGTSGDYLKSIGAHTALTETVRSFGLIGGTGGEYWDDGKHNGIKQIKVAHGTKTDSVTVQYDDNGVSSWSPKHGGNGGSTTTINLDLDEFLISISGYYSSRQLVSLSFHTNKKVSGPYGLTSGTFFSTPSYGGKIAGLFGKSASFLDAIGVHLSVPPEPFQSVGTFGGPALRGREGSYWDDGKHNGIKGIKIGYGDAIDSITVEYDDNGISTWSAKHGGSGGSIKTFALDQPGEYLVSISGYYSTFKGNVTLVSLTFETNKRTFGPYGLKTGTYFSLPKFRGKIVGLFGKSGPNVYAIGAHIVPAELIQRLGPFGGPDGGDWDDGKHTGIRQIKIGYGLGVESISFEYDDNGVSSWSSKHGGSAGSIHTITLDYPDEFLITVSGYYSNYRAHLVLVSLTFETNKRKYGPYGPENGTHFSFPSFGSKIIGFFGRSGDCVDSIGAHIVPIEKIQSTGPFGGLDGGYWDDGIHTDIKQIKVAYGLAVDSITIEYSDNGVSTWSAKHGGAGGGTQMITLITPDEFLVSISGYYYFFSGQPVIQSITFQTNKRKFGPYGPQKGMYFILPSSGGKIVGLFGKSGKFLDSLGAHVKSVPGSFDPFYTDSFGGTVGNSGGEKWDDGVYDAVRKITVGPTEKGIQHVSFEYEKSGEVVVAEGHGDKPIKLYHAELDFPDEFVTSISAFYDEVTGDIQSVKFHTNKGTFGPYGTEKGTPFE